jgi:lysophospholipase L1-like esterase
MANRRTFIKTTALTGLGMVAVNSLSASNLCREKTTTPLFEEKSVILFQGDSITDGNRGRNDDWNHVMGHGYAYLIASRLWCDFPQMDWMFYNRGISGNTVTDLCNRWQTDAMDLQPNVVSILVGINDVYGIVKGYLQQSIDEYETKYRQLLDDTKSKLPQCKIVLMEPFILPGGRVDEKTDVWQRETQLRQQVVSKLAEEYKIVYVPLQTMFTEACNRGEAKKWIWDGIHPMPAGHELIARQWLKCVGASKTKSH